ncbi:autophagy protein Apg6-domain-containing protein [Phialemonium atrogriseum]|uniref:Autophagy protein Apg6-domain-containing protein n=1 Tax=Phialemonium atrogriseum TaxID=1093897 RepID=A0AAJ0C146_9PEZI|nr:autophagy protein Apg6-domain-containing protein [Phialemonium atrogriseum]KAK1767178.1 autophagy protein Apg6-domain-containing protein [Phialemonium atrogriseum]
MYCQKCRTPLKLDGSLEDLNPAAYDLLVATHSQQPPRKLHSSRPLQPQDKARKSLLDKVSQNAGPATFKRHNAPKRGSGGLRDSSAMSFILLTESQVAPPNHSLPRSPSRQNALPHQGLPGGGESGQADDDDSAKSHEMERIAKLFEILSARSDVDHPICVECTEILVEEMQKKLETTARERDAYVNFLQQLQANLPTDDELRVQEEAVEKARKEEAAALSELRKLEDEKASLDAELLALEAEAQQLDEEEEGFWRERNAFAAKLADFQNERDSINSKFDHDSRLLEKLQRSNVYNDTFCISHDGTFATINGLRLGRLSNKPVDWPEINAAWGHSLLLLVTVADKLGYKFEGYEPQPMGSTSKIVRYDPVSPSSSRLGGYRNAPPPAPKKHVLDLYSSGDMPLGLTFMHRKFDNAMIAFLELVRQLGEHVQRQTGADGNPLGLPYKIEGDRIGDVSIKLGIAQDDGWTKACKLTLTCCKFLLAHASNLSSVSNGRASGGP